MTLFKESLHQGIATFVAQCTAGTSLSGTH